MMDIPRPVALITGASSGIGEVFARKLSERGCRVLLVSRRMDRLQKLAEELGNAEALRADLTADKDIFRIEARIAAESNLQFLVNNAGFGVPGSFFEADIEALDRMNRLHVIAIERLTHAALKGMVRRGMGNIINVSSVAAYFNTLHSSGYCATKAWINSFTEGVYLDLKNSGSPVRIQALCPGFTYTEFHDVTKMDRTKVARSLWMTPEDVVEDSLRGLQKNKLIVIPGRQYRLFVALIHFLPRFLKHYIAIKFG